MTNTDQNAGHFGFKPVAEGEKQGLVDTVFAKVASRYDVMNDVMSAGLHRVWKDAAVNWLAPPRNAQDFRVVDVAGGTGDIAFRIIEAAGSNAQVAICDISPGMLEQGAHRAATRGLAHQVSFTRGNGESLPFADRSFDAYTIAFGIRNVPQISSALREAYRVLKPGGRFMCLEFSQVEMPVLDKIYDFYSFNAIPVMGGFIAGDAAAYRYLVESIRQFPDQDSFAAMIRSAGFAQVSYRNLSGGIAAMHSAWRI